MLVFSLKKFIEILLYPQSIFCIGVAKLDYLTMNNKFDNDIKGFNCKLSEFLKKRKEAYLTIDIIIGFFIGISATLYLSNLYPINNLTLTINTMVISALIGALSLILGWDSQKRGDFGMEYSELRFNYVMQFIKIVYDKIP